MVQPDLIYSVIVESAGDLSIHTLAVGAPVCVKALDGTIVLAGRIDTAERRIGRKHGARVQVRIWFLGVV